MTHPSVPLSTPRWQLLLIMKRWCSLTASLNPALDTSGSNVSSLKNMLCFFGSCGLQRVAQGTLVVDSARANGLRRNTTFGLKGRLCGGARTPIAFLPMFGSRRRCFTPAICEYDGCMCSSLRFRPRALLGDGATELDRARRGGVNGFSARVLDGGATWFKPRTCWRKGATNA